MIQLIQNTNRGWQVKWVSNYSVSQISGASAIAPMMKSTSETRHAFFLSRLYDLAKALEHTDIHDQLPVEMESRVFNVSRTDAETYKLSTTRYRKWAILLLDYFINDKQVMTPDWFQSVNEWLDDQIDAPRLLPKDPNKNEFDIIPNPPVPPQRFDYDYSEPLLMCTSMVSCHLFDQSLCKLDSMHQVVHFSDSDLLEFMVECADRFNFLECIPEWGVWLVGSQLGTVSVLRMVSLDESPQKIRIVLEDLVSLVTYHRDAHPNSSSVQEQWTNEEMDTSVFEMMCGLLVVDQGRNTQSMYHSVYEMVLLFSEGTTRRYQLRLNEQTNHIHAAEMYV